MSALNNVIRPSFMWVKYVYSGSTALFTVTFGTSCRKHNSANTYICYLTSSHVKQGKCSRCSD